MVTIQNEVQDNEKARKAGVSDIISKPFTAESLKQALEGGHPGRPAIHLICLHIPMRRLNSCCLMPVLARNLFRGSMK